MVGNLGSPNLNIFGENKSVSLENASAIEGNSFLVSRRLSVSSGGFAYWLSDPTETVGLISISFPLVIESAGAGPLYTDLYLLPTISDFGDEIRGVNRDLRISTPSVAKFSANPTVSDEGILTPLQFSTFSDRKSSAGGVGGASFATVINPLLPLLFKIQNQDVTGDADITVSFAFIEDAKEIF